SLSVRFWYTLYYHLQWVPAEIFLFVLVGASVEIRAMVSAGFSMVVLIFGVLLFRMLGVFACLIHTSAPCCPASVRRVTNRGG
ncbi:MAG: hypothetical protein IJQ81_14905, partial [Oscillibacter sp.]|nr:hypothetical protein [Oscillibacter sp.]